MAGERSAGSALPARGFLAGGGEMGERVRSLDWSATSLGPPSAWPQSLRSPLSMMLPSRAQIVLFWGPDFTVFYNDAYRPVFGAKHPWALGRPGHEAWSEIWDGVLHDLLAGVVRTGEAFSAQDHPFLLERHGFQEETWFDVSYDPIRGESGSVVGVYCIVTETTQRVLSERRMALLKDLAAGNATARTEHEACEQAMHTLAGAPGDVAFASVYVDGKLQASTPAAQDQQAAAEHARTVPLGNGTGRLVIGLNPRLPFDERYRRFLELVADQVATALANARAYEDERRRVEALAELDRAKTAFFSNVSHEFRTPLTLMLGPAERLLDEAGSSLVPAQREQLQIIRRNAGRLLKLVNTLLDFSRIEAGRMEARFRPVDLAALTRELASGFRSAIEHAGLVLEVDCPPLGAPVHVDEDMWEKIVLNLLSNAVKYTFAGTIRIELASRGDQVELRVTDTGTGIAPAELPRIFERFHRVEGARARTHEGSGIGLALTQELVRLHGGTIEAASHPGRGTTFTLRIPIRRDHIPAMAGADASGSPAQHAGREAFAQEAERWESPSEARGGEPGSQPGRILVVDDNADMRDYLAQLLRDWQVEAVANGTQALERCRRAPPPDLVISDVMMPGVDGFDLLAALRAGDSTRAIPVLLLSARAGEEARVQGLAAGADDYLTKPFGARLLRARVRSLLDLAAERRALQLQKQHLRDLFVQAPTPILVLRGPGHRIELANAATCRIWGRNENEVTGRPLLEVRPQAAGRFLQLLDRVLATGESYLGREAPVQGATADDTVWFNFVYEPLREADGSVGGVMVVAFEVTEEIRARHQLAGLQQAAEAANVAKDQFLAMLGHELRNPLAPILTTLQLMRLRSPDSAVREREIIERQVRHLARLVDDLLDVSRIARGKIELRRTTVETAQAVVAALESAGPLLEERRHHVEVDVPQAGLPLHADLARLVQVLSNVIGNAAKYTDAGGRIRVVARRAGEDVEISVADNGQGVSVEMLPLIFDMFRQERPVGSGSSGLGLGLTIARTLVEQHGGTIEAHSAGAGQGCEVLIRLPRAPAAVAEAARTHPSPAPPPARRYRVLIVDDNLDAAVAMQSALHLLGHDAAIAPDGPDALLALPRFSPDVVLLDLGLPVMDGYEVAAEIARAGYCPALVALTGYGQESDIERTRTAGFDGHLVKPVELDQLMDMLDRLTARPPRANLYVAA